jgi:magnesium-transporting ATPase (P-type)
LLSCCVQLALLWLIRFVLFARVIRDGQGVPVNIKNVVPGDIVVLKPGLTYCDTAVVKADHVLVDESALTGEATPIVKTAIDPAMQYATFNQKKHKSNVIAAGSEILEVGEAGTDLGLVLTTGSFTTKGELLTEVMSYQRHQLKFDSEAKIVLLILAMEAIFLLSMVLFFLKEQWDFGLFYGRWLEFRNILFFVMRGEAYFVHCHTRDVSRWSCDSSVASNGLCCSCWYICQASSYEAHFLYQS